MRSVYPKVIAALVLCFFSAGCSVDTVGGLEEDGPLIQTSKEVYTVERTEDALKVEIPLTFYNETGQTVYISYCHYPQPPVLQKRIDGAWENVYAPVVLQCLEPPVVIEEGEQYEYTYEVYATLLENAAPKLHVDEVKGTYRLVWELYSSYEEYPYELLPLEARVSNTFRLVLAN